MIMGLDLSLEGTGWAVYDILDGKDSYNAGLVKVPLKYIDLLRIDYIRDYLYRLIIDEYKPSCVYIEGVSFGSRGQGFSDIIGLNYIIQYMLFKKEIPFVLVPPTTLKKHITGKGNAKKNLMLMKVYKKYGVEFEDDNLCDAYCLARYGYEKERSNG